LVEVAGVALAVPVAVELARVRVKLAVVAVIGVSVAVGVAIASVSLAVSVHVRLGGVRFVGTVVPRMPARSVRYSVAVAIGVHIDDALGALANLS
jgi:hypothetical protein